MKIRGYLKTSAIEWPGKIAAVVFVPGCNFRCPFCYNRDLVLDSSKLPKFSQTEVLTDLINRRSWLDVVVVTGGEPTLQKNLDGFLMAVKKLGLALMIETNGSLPSVLGRLLKKGLLQRVAMDIKGPLDRSYGQITNGKSPLSRIRKSIKLILDSGIDFEFRTTVVPGIHDLEVLVKMAGQLKQIRPNLVWYLQTFRPDHCLEVEFRKVKPYSYQEMGYLLRVVRRVIPSTELR